MFFFWGGAQNFPSTEPEKHRIFVRKNTTIESRGTPEFLEWAAEIPKKQDKPNHAGGGVVGCWLLVVGCWLLVVVRHFEKHDPPMFFFGSGWR